ncbi:MAG: TonB-dependent siderophore receptor [Rickettsiaceae bacterium]|jgi:catecholate siderophore receptor|nr:TonB-dependent siderophore receptor [Rickettsiaceae bacterium]
MNSKPNRLEIANRQINKFSTTALALIISLSSSVTFAEESTKLPTVTVKEKSEKEDKGYKSGTTNIGKTNQAAKDVPQSLTIVNRDLMDDRGATTFQDALRNVAGLTFNAGEGGRVGDNITIRGFGASSDLYRDGMRDNAQYNRDIFDVEQVEALRGAASMLFGRGSTGGIINQVSKEPELGKTSNVNLTVGSHSFFRETLDYNQEVGDSAAIRLNVMKTDSESHRKTVKRDSFGVAPSFKWGIDTANEFLLSYSHLEYDDTPDYGIPLRNADGARPVRVDYDNFYGLKSDSQKDSSDVYTGKWTHKFDDDSQLKTTIRHHNVDRNLFATAPRFNTAPTDTSTVVSRQRQARGAEEQTNTFQSEFSSKFKLLDMKHEGLIGIEYLYETADRWTNTGAAANPTTDLYHPNPSEPFATTFTRTNPISFKDTDLGIYAQDLIEFVPNWKLLLGGRYDDFRADYKSTTTATGATTRYSRNDRVFSYRTGLMYQPSDYSTYYVSYGTSFNPSGDLYAIEALTNANAGKTDPEKSVNMEVGGKWELFDGNLSLRTALFRSEKTNERNTDPAVTSVVLLSGKRHTDGVEFEANGKLTANWELFGSIALMDAKIDKHINPRIVGLAPANTPKVSGNIWTTYKLTPEFKIGGGVDFVGERTAFSTSGAPGTMPNVRKVAGYARYDAMAEWSKKQYSVRLNVFNLLNKEYYDSIYQTSGAHAIPGIDRSAQVTVGYKF